MRRGLLDPTEPIGGLLEGGWSQSPELVDRMSMLPIGQHEDGSLTLAWPGMLKDMYEGAVRSYEQGRQLPRVDEQGNYAGTPRAEPLDAFNAASIAPMAGVGMRAAGMAQNVGREAAEQSAPLKVRGTHYTTSDFDKFDPEALGGGGDAFGRGVYSTPMEWVAAQEARTPGRGFSYGSRFEDGARNLPTEHTLENPFSVDYADSPGRQTDWGNLRSNWFGPKWRHDMAPWQAAEAGHFGGFRGDAAQEFNAALKAHGYDGVAVYNDGVMQEIMSLQPGTVRSPLSGETLFANDSRSALPAIVTQGVESAQPGGYRLIGGPGETVSPEFTPTQLLGQLAGAHADLVPEVTAQYRLSRRLGDGPLDAARAAFDYGRDMKRDMRSSWYDAFMDARAGDRTPFHYDITDDAGSILGSADGKVAGDTMWFDWLGGSHYNPADLGIRGVRQLREQVRRDFPNVKKFEGVRVSGARESKQGSDALQSVILPANPSTSSLPSLLLQGQEEDPERRGAFESEGLLDAPPFSPFPLRMYPPQQTDDQFWQQFNNEQLYRGVPREQIPPSMRPPIEVPPVEPVWPEDFWRHQIR
jgi:hypothetical protein